MRPDLDEHISVQEFREFYWLKTELVSYCRTNSITIQGAKKELESRIEHFIKTGEKLPYLRHEHNKKIREASPNISLEGKITEQYKNGEASRKFFKSVIGERFKFNVVFMKWMKENSDKTFKEAIDEWLKIELEVKSGKKKEIDSQFEYNQYTRDFFSNNPHNKREDAIKCWSYKKGFPGSNKYETSDLVALKNV